MDVDGVLNPFPDTPNGYDEYDFFPEDDEPVRLTRVHGDWLKELGAVFELVWATGWGADANRFICPQFGLRECVVLELPPIPFEPRHKVPATASFAGDRPAAWVDDMVTPEAHEWAGSREAPTLLVGVDSATGLTRPAVDELLAWAADLSRKAASGRRRE